MNKQDIQTIRTSLRLNQRDFAKKVGVSQKTIWQWESGRSEPNAEFQERLSAISQEVVKSDGEVIKEGSQGSQNEVVKVSQIDGEVSQAGSQGSQN